MGGKDGWSRKEGWSKSGGIDAPFGGEKLRLEKSLEEKNGEVEGKELEG